jgi:NADH dehydrogenase I D subunit
MSDEATSPEEEAAPEPSRPLSVDRLEERFASSVLSAEESHGTWTVVVAADVAHDALSFLQADDDLAYHHLSDLTAVDLSALDPADGGSDDGFHIVYHLASHRNVADPELRRLRVTVPVTASGPSLPTASDIWTGAEWAEREIWDMFGLRFDGHPDMRRLLMPDSFEAHPLLKSYPRRGNGERTAFNFEVSASKLLGKQPDTTWSPDGDDVQSETMILNFGPQHPATHGTLHLEVELDGERIVRCSPHLGYLHTGFEKLAEDMHWNQWIVVSDRMNYLSPMSNNFGYVVAAERLMDMEIPKRAQYIRVALAELARIADHMVWLGTHALDIGAFTVFLYAFQQREKAYEIFEACSGARLTVSYMRIGGLVHDTPDSFEPMLREFVDAFSTTALPEIEGMLSKNRIWIDRTKGVGVLDADEAVNAGVTGPVLRGSGVEWDVRKADPYSSYEDFDFDIPVGVNGDTYDRYLVRLEELRQSCRIITQALDRMPGGPVNVDDHKVKMPDKSHVYKIPDHTHRYDPGHPQGSIEGLIHHFKTVMDGHGVQIPVGEAYAATESPNGELGFYVVSDGTGTPYRVRVRAPSFYNYQMVPKLLRGHMVSDIVTVLGSVNVIAGELDR